LKMNRKKRLIGLIILLIVYTTIFATNYLVSGSSTISANGVYQEAGEYCDHPYYTYGIYYLFYEGINSFHYRIGNGLGFQYETEYYNSTIGAETPIGEWLAYNDEMTPPTVSEYTGNNFPPGISEVAANVMYDQAILSADIYLTNDTSTVVQFDVLAANGDYDVTVSPSQSPLSNAGTTTVSVTLTGLTNGSYLYSLTATTATDTSYSYDYTFEVDYNEETLPVVEINPAANVSPTSAQLSGRVNSRGNLLNVYFKYWESENLNTIQSVAAEPSTVNDTVSIVVSKTVTGLQPFKDYTYRIDAGDQENYKMSPTMSFATTAISPTVITNDPVEMILSTTELGAEYYGIVNPNNLETSVRFEYGNMNDYYEQNVYYYQNLNGFENYEVNLQVGALEALVYYKCRIVASNTAGTSYGSWKYFQAYPLPPTIITGQAENIAENSATLTGSINPNYEEEEEWKNHSGRWNYDGLSYVSFEYGITTDYGNTIQDSGNPYMGTYSQSCSASISGLEQGTLYHYRIVAENDGGTYYGEDQTFITTGLNRPINVSIEITVENNVIISWDPVSGAASYKVYSSENPYTGFAEVTNGTFVDDESWMSSASGSKKFYHVTAVN
jgi:hypothetical protein